MTAWLEPASWLRKARRWVSRPERGSSPRQADESANSSVSPDRGSTEVLDRDVIESFTSDPRNTFLVSFPRTGSHWLRMLMELYFERPSLRRIFYHPDRDDFLTFHTHDLELDVVRSRVIYLYRDPVPTIYSQLSYHHEDISDPERTRHWADLYGRHLSRWLHEEEFTTRKTVIRYERMRSDLSIEFAKICEHFDQDVDERRLAEVASRVTREHVDRKTSHDPQVIDLRERYRSDRERFREESAALVWESVLKGRPWLEERFDGVPTAPEGEGV